MEFTIGIDVLRGQAPGQGASLPYSTCCHTFRATGNTAYLENGSALKNAQAFSASIPPDHKTSQPPADEITLDELERMAI
jgi:hypothetical protein